MRPRICLNCGSLEYRVDYVAYTIVELELDGEVYKDDLELDEISGIECYECYEEVNLIDFEIVCEDKREVAKALLSAKGDDRIVVFANLVKDGKIKISDEGMEKLIVKLKDMGHDKLAVLLKVFSKGD